MTDTIKQFLLSGQTDNIDIGLILFFTQEGGTMKQLLNFISDCYFEAEIYHTPKYRVFQNHLLESCIPFSTPQTQKDITTGCCYKTKPVEEGLKKYLKLCNL
tara:strand:- start:401 stop:706 length:306 start_codon:yes stop_codon:yes gene_type:complete